MRKRIVKIVSTVLLIALCLLIGEIYFTDTMYILSQDRELQTGRKYGTLDSQYYKQSLLDSVWSNEGTNDEMYLMTKNGMFYFNLKENSLYLFYDFDKITSLNTLVYTVNTVENLQKKIKETLI